ncbi:MAG: carboxypeptidase regulatory-like domain-containing protein [Acidobacteria bacterium]|nr:carboxypeptidase regulatory-like domain-containing protein [Acidobacteriota bacterium]
MIFAGQNTTCADLNASALPAFGHITEDWGIKFDKAADNTLPNGSYTFTQDLGAFFPRTLQGGGPSYPFRSVTFSTANSPARMISFNSGVQITAVIIKAGPDSYVYPYSPFTFADTDLNTGDNRGISHVVFCYGLNGGPTAADGSISGRVVNSEGNPVPRARITLVNGSSGETRMAMTNSFGYYQFSELDVNEFYLLSVSHKRYRFDEAQRAISLFDNLTDVDFVAYGKQQF